MRSVSIVRSLFAAALSFSLVSQAAVAGTLTVTTGPTVTLSGSVSNTSASNPPNVPFAVNPFQFGNSTALKLTGNQFFTELDGGTGSIVVTMSGNASANAGDFFSLFYDFTLTLLGTGTVTPAVSASGTVTPAAPPIPIPFNTSTNLAPATSGTTRYFGGTQTAAIPVAANGTYTANVTFNWAGASPGDTLRIFVPANSIDFALAPTAVPEPAAAGLLGLGALLYAGRRRAHSRAAVLSR